MAFPKGRREGIEGRPFSPEDEALSIRRYEAYIELTKNKKPYTYGFLDILPLLPMDGGTKHTCGHTRFEHLVEGHCGDYTVPRCHEPMRTPKGAVCGRQKGHTRGCESEASIEKRKIREAGKARERWARRKAKMNA